MRLVEVDAPGGYGLETTSRMKRRVFDVIGVLSRKVIYQ
jgi:hypothetical protein